jgi:hypothetical protein
MFHFIFYFVEKYPKMSVKDYINFSDLEFNLMSWKRNVLDKEITVLEKLG